MKDSSQILPVDNDFRDCNLLVRFPATPRIVASPASGTGAAPWLARNDTVDAALVNVTRNSQSAAVQLIRRWSDYRKPPVLTQRYGTAADHILEPEVLSHDLPQRII
jgi:hypothetical protein